MTEIVKRSITIFLLFFFLSFLYLFGNNTAFIFFISVVSIYSLYEWTSISSKHIVFLPIFIILNSVLYYFDFVNTYYLSIITLFFNLTLQIKLIFHFKGLKIEELQIECLETQVLSIIFWL